MDSRIREIAKKIGEERGIPEEVKKIRNSYYLYKDTTRGIRRRRGVSAYPNT